MKGEVQIVTVKPVNEARIPKLTNWVAETMLAQVIIYPFPENEVEILESKTPQTEVMWRDGGRKENDSLFRRVFSKLRTFIFVFYEWVVIPAVLGFEFSRTT